MPQTRNEESTFYMFHESTDCIIILSLMFSLRTKEYIPYYRVVHFDEEELNIHNHRRIQKNADTIRCAITNREVSHGVEDLNKGDLAIIVGPDDPDFTEESKQDLTYINKKCLGYRRLKVGCLASTTGHEYYSDDYLFYNSKFSTKSFREKIQ